jgi:hypothetical protein
MRERQIASFGPLKIYVSEYGNIDVCLYEITQTGIRYWESSMSPEYAYNLARTIMEASEELLEEPAWESRTKA